ncbi:MAG TPA: PqqD family protein, partial [Pyrinomonadaceae bacterium]
TAPLARKRERQLVIDELPDEVLVYDLDRHKAHCLNETAALVWQHCDGKSTPSQIARRLTRKIRAPFNEELVWLALSQLEKLHLLEQSISLPPKLLGMSRRQMIRNLGLAAAVAVPVVTSIVAPTAAEASTCIPSGHSCSTTIKCCSSLGCNGTPGAGGVCN